MYREYAKRLERDRRHDMRPEAQSRNEQSFGNDGDWRRIGVSEREVPKAYVKSTIVDSKRETADSWIARTKSFAARFVQPERGKLPDPSSRPARD